MTPEVFKLCGFFDSIIIFQEYFPSQTLEMGNLARHGRQQQCTYTGSPRFRYLGTGTQLSNYDEIFYDESQINHWQISA